jgi:hypothetical protein
LGRGKYDEPHIVETESVIGARTDITPRGINIERLRDPHVEWNRHFHELGLSPEWTAFLDVAARSGILARFSSDRATRLLDVGLDFCRERSVAVDAGDAVAVL